MGNSKFSLIKQSFFNHSPKQNNFSFKEKEFDLNQLKYELSTMNLILMSNKSHWMEHDSIVLYLLLLCDLLIQYYELDYVCSEIEKLKQIRKKVESYGKTDVEEDQKSIDSFLVFIFDELQTNILGYVSSFMSISKLRQYIGNINSKRSQFSYSRGLANYLIVYLQKSSISKIIEEFNQIINNPYSFIEGIHFLNVSRKAITDLGILLYALRFFINLFLLIKHIAEALEKDELAVLTIWKQELEKRGFTMANDLVWAVIGLLTTYYDFFKISESVVPIITVAFLTFDTLLLFAQWIFEANQHQVRVVELEIQLETASGLEHAVIQRQLDILNDEWEAQCSFFVINIVGANIIATSFAMSMLCTGPLALGGLALLALLGNAFYNTAEEYKKYQKSSIALRREVQNSKILDDAHHRQLLGHLKEECNKQYQEFWKSLLFNAGGIAFIITAAVASWPVALGLTLIYTIYRLNDAYQKQLQSKNNVPQEIYRVFDPQQIEENPNMPCYSLT